MRELNHNICYLEEHDLHVGENLPLTHAVGDINCSLHFDNLHYKGDIQLEFIVVTGPLLMSDAQKLYRCKNVIFTNRICVHYFSITSHLKCLLLFMEHVVTVILTRKCRTPTDTDVSGHRKYLPFMSAYGEIKHLKLPAFLFKALYQPGTTEYGYKNLICILFSLLCVKEFTCNTWVSFK